jgi:hypothetical protein
VAPSGDAESATSGETPVTSASVDEVLPADPVAEPADAPRAFATFEDLERYLADAAAIPLADGDSAIPPYDLDSPAGAPGFTRYVFRDVNGEIIPRRSWTNWSPSSPWRET